MYFSVDPRPCVAGLCQHGGRCIDEYEESFFCACDIGYSGLYCEIDILSVVTTTPPALVIGTSRVPVEGKSSACVICMKYRIIILIIIIISLGQIILSYMAANTSRTHARTHTHAHTCAHTHPPPLPSRLSLFDGSVCAQP